MADKLKHINPSFVHEFGSLEFIAKLVVEGFMSGKHKSPYHGFSVEFAEHRLYNSGDSLKHVDWKLYAKTDKLYLKKYESETNLRCKILLDSSSSMFFPIQKEWTREQPNKILFSVYLIASIMQLLKKQRDAFGLAIINDEVQIDTDCKNLDAHIYELYQYLEKEISTHSLKNKSKTSFAKNLMNCVVRQPKRSVFMLFSDLLFDSEEDYEEFKTTLEFMKHNGHEVVIFHTLDNKKEVELDFGDNPIEFVGLENDFLIKTTTDSFKKEYQEQMNLFLKDLKSSISNSNIDYIPVDINQDINSVLDAYMHFRSTF